jgi:DNA-binding GntR family transcriptional regulator
MDGIEAPVTSERVAAELAEAIHEHRIAPGSKLNEDEVGAVFGVSRTVARAALQSLSHQRLVDLRRNKGAFVAQPSAREAREVFEARALLEPRTARSAAERITDDALRRLRGHIEREHAALAEGRLGRALHHSGSFHIEIARIAEQDTIEEIIKHLVARSSLIIALYWRRRLAVCESHAHNALISALAQRDGELAEELMKNHLLDLLGSLDLRNPVGSTGPLRDALKR